MSRRQTLAPLSPSQSNVVKGGNSAAPGRCGKDAALSVKGRKSVAPGMLGAGGMSGITLEGRPSIVTKTTGPKQDPRPLSSKDYQNYCIKTLIHYFTTHGFSYPVSPKTLASPTGKDFTAIVTFLIQQLDPATRVQGKVEDEFPVFLKRLNYPYQVSKSALFAVGAPHSWPAVLGALTWVVEALEYKEKGNSSQGGNHVEEMMDYVGEGYHCFMLCNDARCQELDRQFAEKFHKEEAERGARYEELRKENEQLEEELAQLRSLPDPVDLATEQNREQTVICEKLELLVQQDQALNQAALRKLSEKKMDVQTKQEQIAAAEAEVEKLRHSVASQPVSKADVNRILLERKKLEELVATEAAQCEEMERANHEMEMQAEFCNLDLKGVVKPNLERLRDTYLTRAKQLHQDLTALQEACSARTESTAEKKQEIAALQAENVKLEAQLQATKDFYDEKCRKLTAQADRIKALIEESCSEAVNRTEHMESQISRAQMLYEQVKREGEGELAKLEADYKRAFHLMATHKEFVAGTISRTVATVRQVKGEIAELHSISMMA
ncbi:hypothetical protein VOLCADRAFT_104825 [Volvox carteri f. nagariensis]|uniref:Kinetochore protein NDC80 n=1 Tax=Volvox carteri f. nagariensis TaxID=3068 RepID=D8TWA8_VOLCA|nr:uncharacterized protein VOLCADRAFT_104825 [Volvox carteri f. nagariensis]EFJ48444.1 hypothetical protein VOLCADRAFT_104825 [Volvox carteri f. nagariensis]|eukprot:XP_002950698.1 hypothetical protein VOLCADRAFT_104825 [Volvox carteri f. nagariensis]